MLRTPVSLVVIYYMCSFALIDVKETCYVTLETTANRIECML